MLARTINTHSVCSVYYSCGLPLHTWYNFASDSLNSRRVDTARKSRCAHTLSGHTPLEESRFGTEVRDEKTRQEKQEIISYYGVRT